MFNVKCVRRDGSKYVVYNDDFEECEVIARDEISNGRCVWCTYKSPSGEDYCLMG